MVLVSQKLDNDDAAPWSHGGNKLLFFLLKQSLRFKGLAATPQTSASLLCARMCARWRFIFSGIFVPRLGCVLSARCHRWLVCFIGVWVVK